MDMYVVAVKGIKEMEQPIKYYQFPDLEAAKVFYEQMKANKFVEDVRIYMKTPY